MRKIFVIMVVILLLLGIASACSEPAPEVIEVTVMMEPTPLPAPTEMPPLPFEGVWFTEGRDSVLIITEEYIYFHDFGPNREVYARVDGYDLDAETIDVFVSAIIIGGMGMGYDSPQIQIRYHINGTVMEFWGQHLDFVPDEEGPVLYIYDEFMNGK